MDEMIERVARALSAADGMHPDAVSNDEDSTPIWTLYIRDARAAIEAMREPTKEMHRAAWNSCDRGNHAIDPNPGWDEYNEKVFAAMIDAALTPPAKE